MLQDYKTPATYVLGETGIEGNVTGYNSNIFIILPNLNIPSQPLM